MGYLSTGIVIASVAGSMAIGTADDAHPQALREARTMPSWLSRGLELGYNLDYPEALAVFQAAEAADPDDSSAPRLAAATIWMQILFDQGAITVDDYLGDVRSNVPRTSVPFAKAAAFRAEVDRAVALSEAALRRAPESADAHFQVGAAYAVVASYTATAEGRISGALGPAKRAYQEHERVLNLDPHRLDAGLVVGLYRCATAELSLPMRMIARLAGFTPDHDGGLRLIEEAAAAHGVNEANAQFLRILLYSRADRFDEALDVVKTLQTKFARNRLLWLEEGNAALAAGHIERAKAALEIGLKRLGVEDRPLALGERARWQFAYGSTLVAAHEIDSARVQLDRALDDATRDWLRGRIHREIGKLADLAGNRASALGEYRTANRLCRADYDAACVASVKALAESAYR